MSSGRKHKHLTGIDRVAIEDSLRHGQNINQIAHILGVSWSTLANEIKTYRSKDVKSLAKQLNRNLCIYQMECEKRELCRRGCLDKCATCGHVVCREHCEDYEGTPICPKLMKAPFVQMSRRIFKGVKTPYHPLRSSCFIFRTAGGLAEKKNGFV